MRAFRISGVPIPIRIQKFQDGKGEHRWRIRAGNGEIVADSAEGYTQPAGRDHGLDVVLAAIRGGDFEIEDEPGEPARADCA